MSAPRTRPHVAVLGGGWSGLAAAVTLAEAGIALPVFEAARILGGRARRVDVNGVALGNGLHILIGAYHQALRLIALVSDDPDQALMRLPLDLHVLDTFRLHAPSTSSVRRSARRCPVCISPAITPRATIRPRWNPRSAAAWRVRR